MSEVNSDIYLPAARTGFMLTKDIINKVGRNTAFNIEMDSRAMSPFARPINQFLDVMNDLTFDSRGKTEVEELKCGKHGFVIPTFNDALDKIMDEAYAIQE